MLKRFILCACVLSLAACGVTGSPPGSAGSTAATGPASITQLNTTPIDDQAIHFAFKTFDAVLDTVDALRATGFLVPGTARALAVKSAIVKTQAALNAASAAQRAGSATSYSVAFAQGERALAELRAALKTGG